MKVTVILRTYHDSREVIGITRNNKKALDAVEGFNIKSTSVNSPVKFESKEIELDENKMFFIDINL